MKLYFHGTSKSNLNSILKKGFSAKYGRANFTTNPLYTLSYSSRKTWGTTKKLDIKPVIKEGILLVFKDPSNKMKVAKDSYIIFKKKQKIITGWPNRYKVEQYGYFSKGKLKSLVAAFSYTKNLINELENINEKIVSGSVNENYIKKISKKLEYFLNNKNIQNIELKAPIDKLSSSIIYGMIRNQVLREIRTVYLSKFALDGWKVVNYGTHPVKLKDKQGIKKAIKNIGKIINKRFISNDIRKEYYQLIR